MKLVPILILSLVLIAIFPMVKALTINEIMYNPEGDDNNREYIEIYFENWTDLTGWIIADVSSNDTLMPLQESTSNYALIVEDGFNYTGIDASVYSAGATIGNNLNNDGIEVIFLYDSNQNLIATATYNDSMGADGDGKSLQLCNNSLLANFPTPGTQNNCSQGGNEPPQQQESSIKIVDSPKNAKFGDEIEVGLEIYRGNTSKYAVYIYVEDKDGTDVSNKVTLHCDDKFTNYTETVELELKCKEEQGEYVIVAEGLNERDEEEIKIESCHELQKEEQGTGQEGNEGVTIGDFTYSITIPNKIYLNQEFQVKVKIESQAEQEQEFLVWGYIYIGSKCYSCTDTITRESNAKSIIVSSGDSAEVSLVNIVGSDSAEPGTYKLKVKILQQGLKTPKEFTYNITLESSTLSQTTAQQSQQSQSSVLPPSTYAAYSSNTNTTESESFSFIKIGPYILVSLALLAAIYLIITKI
ncbi:MAG: lamin tail domain-containing protein [Candidatus Pacearchaeota archaeon]